MISVMMSNCTYRKLFCKHDFFATWSSKRFAIFLAPYRSHPKKSRKKVPGASRPRGQKRLKKSRKEVEKVEKRLFLTRSRPFFDFFQPFLTSGPRGPGNLFSTFLGIRARRARMTPVRGQEDRNKRCPSSVEILGCQIAW